MKKFLLTLLTITLMGTMLAPSVVNAKAAGKKQQTRWSIIECPVGEPNPVTSYKTLKKAEKVAGFSFHIPAIKNYKRTEIKLLDKEVFEITYNNKKKNGITFRKARGKEDLSCDYSEYTAIKKQKIKNKTVRFAMKKKKVLNATWYDKGYSYAIVPYKTLTKKRVVSIIKKIN